MKKKILSIMLTLSMLAMFMPCIASAYEPDGTPYDDHLYYKVNGSSVTISDYFNPYYSDVVIPAEIDGLPVTSIDDYAFYCEGIIGVTIPDSVTSIGDFAFCGCDEIKSITIPDSVTSIGSNAFVGCDFTTITIPGSVTNISDHAFAGCDSLETVIMLDGVTSIADTMFNGCENLKNVTM